MNLEKIRKSAKKRLILYILATILPFIIVAVLEPISALDIMKTIEGDALPIDLLVFRWFMFVGLEAYIITQIVKYARIMKSDSYAENYVLKKNDERYKFISLKSYQMAVKIMFYALNVSLIVSAFINRYVFYTVVVVYIFQLLSVFLTRIICLKKY